MYTHPYMDPDGDKFSLQRKVQFDIRFFFCRRGAENIEKMQKTDFKMEYNQERETWYVVKAKDELTKNHRGPEQLVSGFMPENKDDRLCPVRSFRMYLDHLEPRNTYLWQTPSRFPNKKNPNIFYTMAHMGKNTLGPFMKEVSKNCKLSQIYTNHSIWATGITVLTRLKFSASEIMSVSGHKSVQSLANYQRTKSTQKIDMGSGLFQSLNRRESEIELPCPRAIMPAPPPPAVHETALVPVQQNRMPIPQPCAAMVTLAVQEKPNSDTAIVPFEATFDDNIPDFDLLSALCEVENSQKNTAGTVQVPTTVSNTIMNNIPKTSMFSNCQIGTINFNITK